MWKFTFIYSAPLSAVTAKASSGALETMDVYDVDNLTSFLNCSLQNDWIIYGAVSNSESRNNSNKSSVSINELNDPLSKNPVILVIGSEGINLDLYLIIIIIITCNLTQQSFKQNT